MPVALGVLHCRDLARSRQSALDQIENLIVDSVELGSQCGESLQLFLGHCSSRLLAAFNRRRGLRGQFFCKISGRPQAYRPVNETK
jgi:hypothetical protein